MDYYKQVEEAWTLGEAALRYRESSERDVDREELWANVFSQSPLVDLGKTKKEGGSPLSRVFLKSPFGLQYRDDSKDWVPFRHGPIDFSTDPSLARSS